MFLSQESRAWPQNSLRADLSIGSAGSGSTQCFKDPAQPDKFTKINAQWHSAKKIKVMNIKYSKVDKWMIF